MSFGLISGISALGEAGAARDFAAVKSIAGRNYITLVAGGSLERAAFKAALGETAVVNGGATAQVVEDEATVLEHARNQSTSAERSAGK